MNNILEMRRSCLTLVSRDTDLECERRALGRSLENVMETYRSKRTRGSLNKEGSFKNYESLLKRSRFSRAWCSLRPRLRPDKTERNFTSTVKRVGAVHLRRTYSSFLAHDKRKGTKGDVKSCSYMRVSASVPLAAHQDLTGE